MDTRTGQIYASREAALADGAHEADVVPVAPMPTGQAVRVESGPFKGRVYEVVDGKRGRRLRQLEGRRGVR